MKLRHSRFGNQRIAEQISHAFAVQIDKDVVRKVLAKRYGSDLPGASGPSWLTFFAQAKDSRWSVDLFRCDSIPLRMAIGCLAASALCGVPLLLGAWLTTRCISSKDAR